MAFVQQPDAGGDTMKLLRYESGLYPPFPLEVYQGIPSLAMREDDVLVCAYPKAGTHWVWEIVRCLQAGTVNIPVIEKDNSMLECKGASYLDHLPSPRTLNTHLRHHQLPEEARTKRCKLVYINRNPKDLTVSNYHHHRKLTDFYQYLGTWDNFFPTFLDGQMEYGSWFDYVKDWERVLLTDPQQTTTTTDEGAPPVHIMAYENLKMNPVKEILALAKFLGKAEDVEFAEKVADKCSFNKMRSRKGQLETCSNGEPIMYRKGEVGDWVNWFTVQQNEMMDAYYRQLMAGSKWAFTFTLTFSLDDAKDAKDGKDGDTASTGPHQHRARFMDNNMNRQ